jgi:hypothetical protein
LGVRRCPLGSIWGFGWYPAPDLPPRWTRPSSRRTVR